MSPKIDTCSVNATERPSGNSTASISNRILQLTLPMTRHTTTICLLAGRETCHTRAVGNGLSHTFHPPGAVHTLRLHVLGGGGLGGFLPLLSMQGSR